MQLFLRRAAAGLGSYGVMALWRYGSSLKALQVLLSIISPTSTAIALAAKTAGIILFAAAVF